MRAPRNWSDWAYSAVIEAVSRNGSVDATDRQLTKDAIGICGVLEYPRQVDPAVAQSPSVLRVAGRPALPLSPSMTGGLISVSASLTRRSCERPRRRRCCVHRSLICLLAHVRRRLTFDAHTVELMVKEMPDMSVLMWVIAVILLVAAAMLIVDVGAAGLWIAVIAVGIAMVALEQRRRRHT